MNQSPGRTESGAPVRIDEPGPRITAAHIAIAVVAACARTGIAAETVFGTGRGCRRTRLMAAAGCIARLGWPRALAARMFQVQAVKLAPSNLNQFRIDTDDLLAVAEALDARGLTQDNGAGRFREAWEAIPVPAPAPKRKARARRPDISVVAAAEAPKPDPRPGMPARPRRIASADVTPGASARSPAAPRTRPTSAVRADRPRAADRDPARVVQLKPLTDRIVDWTRRQLDLGADVGFVAWCFDVDAELLAEAAGMNRRVAA